MSKKTLPRYKSSKYFARFGADWSGDGLLGLFQKNGELTPESEVGIMSKYHYSEKSKVVYWQRKTREGKENVTLADLEPDENFLSFLDKFFRKWHGGYRKTQYCIMKSICKLYHENPEKFMEMSGKAKNLNEFIQLMAIK